MDETQFSRVLEEVESLVLELYKPGAPDKISKIQEALQGLQRSSEGWRLANSLLGNKNEQVRFFGALTFIVKLNTDAKSLEDDEPKALLQTLIGFLIQFLRNGEGALVIRKLCSTLVAYFMQFAATWQECVKHLTYCLFLGHVVQYDALENAPDASVMIQSLSNEKSVAILWFAATLVEEVGKTDSNSMKQNQFHRSVVPNVETIVPLISRYLTDSSGSADMKVRQESLKCFQAWVSYSHRAFIDDSIVLDSLQTLTQPTIMCMVEEDLYETAIELISDVLTNYSKFLQKDDFAILFSLLNSQWAQERYDQLINGDYDFDSLQFGMFVIAFGDANTQELTKNIGTDSQFQQFLSVLCKLLSAEGYAVHEDKIFVPALEFWNTYVENVLDCSYDEGARDSPWYPAAQGYIYQAIERCVHKLQFPPSTIFSSWDSVDRTGFKDARRDFSDLMQQFSMITGLKIFQFFIDHANKAIQSKNWAELEVSWYIIGVFADSAQEDPERDGYLRQIFDKHVLALFTEPDFTVPTRTKKTFLDLVSGYSNFFESNTENLPTVLNIVFDATSNRALATIASTTISKICSECRHTLLPQLGAFLQQYSNITATSTLDGAVKEGVIQGIAALIQAIPDDESKLAPLDQLLNFVETDIEHCLRLVAESAQNDVAEHSGHPQGANDPAVALGLVALKCLEGMAKGSQTPTDTLVDLEAKETKSPFWVEGAGVRIQERIFSMINHVFDALGRRGEILEATCLILRKGFRDPDPGPFVLPPEVAAQIFLKTDLHTPRLGYAMSSASHLVHTQKWGSKIDGVLDALLNWISQLLQDLQEPGNDPEIAQHGIEFMNGLLSTNIHVFLRHRPPAALEYLFVFTLKALTGRDPLPKAAAAQFWSTLIGLPPQDEDIQSTIDTALQHLGPMLTQALIYNIGGHAARSELEKLSDPIKKIVARRVEAKRWFDAALNDENFPSDNVTGSDKRAFLQKIINLRGQRLTSSVVKDFWLACRGSNFSYAS